PITDAPLWRPRLASDDYRDGIQEQKNCCLPANGPRWFPTSAGLSPSQPYEGSESRQNQAELAHPDQDGVTIVCATHRECGHVIRPPEHTGTSKPHQQECNGECGDVRSVKRSSKNLARHYSP